MTQALAYVRRSTDRQEESLDQQRVKLQAFAKSRGWTLTAVYEDDAISGSDMNRPGLAKLLNDAEVNGDVEIVLAWDRNRLARPKDPIDGMLLERRLIEAGKRVFYASTGQEADRSFASGLMSYVEHHQNGDYLRKLSRDTIRGIVSRVQRGQWPGGPIPFGYDRLILSGDGKPKRIVRDEFDGSQIVIDPDSGDVIERIAKGKKHSKQDDEIVTLIPSEPSRVRAVQRVFADYAAGKPTRQLREWLNDAGFRTSRGNRFSAPTINPILENPAYLGRCVYNRRTLSKWHIYSNGGSVERNGEQVERRPESDWVTVDDAWPALVDQSTFDAVQARRNESREKHRHTTGRATKAGYLLTGLCFCGVCGGRLTGQTTKSGKGYRTRYYVCSSHHNGHKDRCPKRYSVPAGIVEDHIFELIQADLAKLRDDDQLHKYIADELRRITGGHDDARQQLQRQLANLDQQLATLRGHLVTMDAETAKAVGLYDQAKDLAEQRAVIEAGLSKLPDDSPALPSADEIRRRASAAFDDLGRIIDGGTLEEKRDLISLYVEKIEADPHRQTVQISLYPTLFSRKIAGARDVTGHIVVMMRGAFWTRWSADAA
jgi:DNA invertase Pin-like site-specific DNA recombinase